MHLPSVHTDVMAWVMARVTGRSFAQLLHEQLWAPLGCQEEGYVIVDPAGMPSAGGGLSAMNRALCVAPAWAGRPQRYN